MSTLEDAQEAYNEAEYQFRHAWNQKLYWEDELDRRNAAAARALDELNRAREALKPHPFNDANQGYFCCQEPGCGMHRADSVHQEQR